MSNEVKEKFIDFETKLKSDNIDRRVHLYIKYSLIIIVSIIVCYFVLFFSNTKSFNILFDEKFYNSEKSLSDNRNYRVIRLKNRLDVMLVSDVEATKSSASLSVGVGSYSDDIEGTAHFLEHMLFLGSETYPNVGEYEDYLVSNSGSSNAFTEAEKTTFFFSVDHKGLNKSLLMFSRMFVCPLFDKKYLNREIENINSEHEKNLNSDGWRKRQLLRSLSNPHSSNFKFSTGNNDTLRNISLETLEIKLKTFHSDHYSSDNMKLAVITNLPLDQIAEMVRNYFEEIGVKKKIQSDANLPHQSDNKILKFQINSTQNSSNRLESVNSYSKLKYNTTISAKKEILFSDFAYRKEDLSKIIYYKKVTTGSVIDFIFYLPSMNALYRSKPYDYLDYQLKYAGEGSLIEFLLKNNLATKLDCGFSSSHKSFSQYQISIVLTDKGFMKVENIISYFFSYLNLIKTSNISKSIYDEINNIANVNFKFMEKSNEYDNYLTSISRNMFEYQYEHILNADYIHNSFDENMIRDFLSNFNVENLIIMVGSNEESDKFYIKSQKIENEKWYGTQFIQAKINSTFSNVLGLRSNGNPELFKLRFKNEFITNASSLTSCSQNEICNLDQTELDYSPVTYFNNSRLNIYYKVDNSFKLPKIFSYVILSLNSISSTEDFLYLNILYNYLDYNLSTKLSELLQTGNEVEWQILNNGIKIVINAFSDIWPKINEIILKEVFKLNYFDVKTFNDVKEITTKTLKEHKTIKPYQKNLKVYFFKLIKYNFTMYNEILPLIEKVDLRNFSNFYERFREETNLKTLFYGSVNVENVEAMVTLFKQYLQVNEPNVAKTQKGNIFYYHRQIKNPVTFITKNDDENEVNSAVTNFYQVGGREIKKTLYLLAMDKCLGQIFYYNLRTLKGLGYIVNAGFSTIDSVLYFRIIVQGSKADPLTIDKSIDEVILEAREKIKNCNFGSVKDAIRNRLNKRDDNLKERAERVWREIELNTFEFNRIYELIKNIDTIDHVGLTLFFENVFFNNPAKLAIHNYSGKKNISLANYDRKYNLNKFFNVTITQELEILNKNDFIISPVSVLDNKMLSSKIKRLK